MKVLIDINKIETKHIKQVLDFLKSIELKNGNLSQLSFDGVDNKIVYSIWHNKKSFTIYSQVINNDTN